MINQLRLLLVFVAILLLASCEYKDNAIPQKPPLPVCGTNVITGYTNKISYFPGDEVEVFLQSTNNLDCGLGVYDINRKLSFRSNVTLFPQTISSAEPWKNGFNFISNGKIRLPETLASGVYLIENQITIVVKSATPAAITVVYPSNTINAYSASGGKSLYGYNSSDEIAATMVSFQRPMDSPAEKDDCFDCLKWFPSLPEIKINYLADVDLNDYSSIQGKIIMIVGHSEYWTRKARKNFDRFVNEGGHALILSGNTMWWHVRYTSSADVLICHRVAELDPEGDPLMKTVRWVDPILNYSILSSIGEDFDHGGYGLKSDKGWDGFKIASPTSPLFEGLSFSKGDILNLPSDECDGAPIKGWDANGFPILDNDVLQFAKLELIGFDRGFRGQETFPTFTVMQKTKTSGVIINVGTTNWCSSWGIGSQNSGNKIKAITRNAIVKLLNGSNVFSN